MFLKVDNVGAERMYSGRLLQATGPATQNAWTVAASRAIFMCMSWCQTSFGVTVVIVML